MIRWKLDFELQKKLKFRMPHLLNASLIHCLTAVTKLEDKRSIEQSQFCTITINSPVGCAFGVPMSVPSVPCLSFYLVFLLRYAINPYWGHSCNLMIDGWRETKCSTRLLTIYSLKHHNHTTYLLQWPCTPQYTVTLIEQSHYRAVTLIEQPHMYSCMQWQRLNRLVKIANSKMK